MPIQVRINNAQFYSLIAEGEREYLEAGFSVCVVAYTGSYRNRLGDQTESCFEIVDV